MAHTIFHSLSVHCNLIWGQWLCRPSRAFGWPKLSLWVDQAPKAQKQKQMCCVRRWERAKQMSCVVEKHCFLMPGRLIESHANTFRHKPPLALWQVTAREGGGRGGEPIKFPFLNIDRLVICAETLESELLTSAAFTKCFSTAQNYVWKNAEDGRIKCAVFSYQA